MLGLPLRFRPSYHTLVWGGRRMARWRRDLPDGPVGESWDLADHERGMTVVADGPLAGRSLRELVAAHGRDLVGAGFAGGEFPLLVKMIDANDRLSVQVHPDDRLARELNVAPRGKTECWLLLADGGQLYAGTRPGTTAEAFRAGCADGSVAGMLNTHQVRDGDFFFLPARRVHALGAGCLLYEVQQTCDVTFRVYDWGRVGLDGKPRPLHLDQAMRTIDFADAGGDPVEAEARPHPAGGTVRTLAACPYFTVEERRVPPGARTGGGGADACSIVICCGGSGWLGTAAGAVELDAMSTWLVPAAAGAWTAGAAHDGLRLLVARPAF
jgi:mannose-6-phosphate isomerase